MKISFCETNSKRLVPGLVLIISFVVYFLTTARLPVNIADSNELMTAAYTRGIAHPPSYPLYAAFMHAVMRLPFITAPAFAANLTSALFQSISLVCFYLISIELSKLLKIKQPQQFVCGAGVIGTMTLAFSYFFWDQATYAEVYGLNNLFIALFLLLFLRTHRTLSLYVTSGLLGVALSHHQTVALFLPAYLYILLKKKQAKLLYAFTFIYGCLYVTLSALVSV